MHKLKAYIKIARPHQYVKNAFIIAPLFFGNKLLDITALVDTLLAFLVFSFAASSVYVLNDLKDIDEDRHHPVKKFRPLASGVLTPSRAIIFLSVLSIVSISMSLLLLPKMFLLILIAYLVLNYLYSFYLKHIAIIDVSCIGIGFVIRIFAGGVAGNVPVSHWIILVTFLLAIFLALGKRLDDLLVAVEGKNTRKALDGYNLEFVSLSMVIMASVIIVSYILYTVSPEVMEKHGTNKLYLTSFWVILGILRYMQIATMENKCGSPTTVLYRDRFLQIIILMWILSIHVILYGFNG